jgi:hypothetical protein
MCFAHKLTCVLRHVHLQELHSASGFKPPPVAPEASLARASHLAKQSLMRRSQMGRVSVGLNKVSRQPQSTTGLGRTSALGRMSRDPAAAMQVSVITAGATRRIDPCVLLGCLGISPLSAGRPMKTTEV